MNIKTGKYRHFKGNIYQVICVARNSETLEEMVVYQDVDNREKIWVRPLTIWNEEIVLGGKTIKRFTYIGE